MSSHEGIHRLLVPLDGSSLAEQAIPYAAALSKGGAELVFLFVAPAAEPVRDVLGRVAVQPDEVEDIELEQGGESLRGSVVRWKTVLPGEPRIEVAIGDPASEIIEAAGRLECDLIVAASHGRGAVGRLAFGSVADRLTRSATVPVLVVRPRDAEPEIEIPRIERIVIPYDGSDLAAGAFPVAISLAKNLGASVLLIRAITPTVYAPVPTPMEPYYAPEVFSGLIEEIEAEAKSSLEEAKKIIEADGIATAYEMATGTAFDVITERTRADDLIVTTSHGRSGVKRWLLGSVAEKLVREGPVAVVLVPSPGRSDEDESERTE